MTPAAYDDRDDDDYADDDGGDSDWDEPDAYGAADDYDDDTPVVSCPHCGSDVYEEADHCPACGEYFVPATNAWAGKPWWWSALGLAGILAVVLLLSGLIRWL